MKKEIEELGSNAVGVLKDPFNKTSIKSIYVSSYKGYSGILVHYGKVEFDNGNTKGEQKFEGESFDDVVLKIKRFIDLELN